jgi:hypothetical protein
MKTSITSLFLALALLVGHGSTRSDSLPPQEERGMSLESEQSLENDQSRGEVHIDSTFRGREQQCLHECRNLCDSGFLLNGSCVRGCTANCEAGLPFHS